MATVRPDGVYGNVIDQSRNRLMMLDEAYPTFAPLDGHRMETDDVEETDKVEYPTLKWNRETLRFQPRSITIIESQVDGVTGTITVPAFEYSRLQEKIEGGDIPTFVSVRMDTSYDNRFAKVLRCDAPPSPLNDQEAWAVENFDEIDTPEGAQTTVSAPNKGLIYPMRVAEVKTIASTALYAVLFTFVDTGFLQSGFPPKDILVAGADADAYLAVGSSASDSYQNRWDTLTEITHAIGTGNIVTSIVQDGGIIVGTWADDIDPATATDGGTFAYVSGAVTLGTTITTPMYGVSAIDGTFVFVGKGGVIYKSTYLDPATITQVVHAVTSEHLWAVAGDIENDVFYIVSTSGSLLTLVSSSVSDISAYLPGSPSDLRAVHVLAEDHVAVAGDSGYFAEHRNATRASAANQYAESALNGGSGVCRAIGGNDLRVLVAVDTALFERSVLTFNDARMEFSELSVDGGAPSGDITALATLTRFDEQNFGVAVTDDAEILYINPTHATR